MTDAEPDFSDDVAAQKESVNTALNELTDVKAYTLSPDELEAFKAAQYGLRVLSDDRDTVSNREKLDRLFNE